MVRWYRVMCQFRQIFNVSKWPFLCFYTQFDIYIQEMEEQLRAQFIQADGSVIPFYSKSNQTELTEKKIELTRLIEIGNDQGFISDSDAKEMTPNGKAARLYGQPKVHKPIPEGKNIPPMPTHMQPIWGKFRICFKIY